MDSTFLRLVSPCAVVFATDDRNDTARITIALHTVHEAFGSFLAGRNLACYPHTRDLGLNVSHAKPKRQGKWVWKTAERRAQCRID